MSLSEFLVLNENDKKQAVLHQGVLIAKRVSDQSMIFLFTLGNYYVETFFDVNNKQIEKFRIGESTDMLDPYLPAISLAGLMED